MYECRWRRNGNNFCILIFMKGARESTTETKTEKETYFAGLRWFEFRRRGAHATELLRFAFGRWSVLS